MEGIHSGSALYLFAMNSPAPILESPVDHREDDDNHIVLFMYDLARTGVVANAVRMVNTLAARGRRVALLVCSEHGRDFHRIDPAVTVLVAPPPALLRWLPR